MLGRDFAGRAEEDISSLFSSITSLVGPVIIMLFLQAVRGEAGAGVICDVFLGGL